MQKSPETQLSPPSPTEALTFEPSDLLDNRLQFVRGNPNIYSKLGYSAEPTPDGVEVTLPTGEGWNRYLKKAGITDRRFVDVGGRVEDGEYGASLKRREVPYATTPEARLHDATAHALGYAAAPSRAFDLMVHERNADSLSSVFANPSGVDVGSFRSLYINSGMRPLTATVLGLRDYQRYWSNVRKLTHAAAKVRRKGMT